MGELIYSPISKLHEEMLSCRRCLEVGHQIVPGAVFRGQVSAELLLIGQAPGVTEVEAKRPFNASSGRRLFQWLGRAGFDEADFRERHYMTAVTKCYPGKGKNGKGDRVPSRAEQALCRPFLEQEIALVNPKLIILVGGLAIKLLFPKSAKLKDLIGTAVYFPPETPATFEALAVKNGLSHVEIQDLQLDGRYIVPLPHPSGASLWPNKFENKLLIEQAIQLLAQIREAWDL